MSLLTANYYKIHSFILAMVPNKIDADDVLQLTVTYMWENFEDFEQGSNFIAWAITIAKYQVLTYRKKKKRNRLILSVEAIDLVVQENHNLYSEMDDRYEALKLCAKKLPTKELDLFKKRFVHDVSVKKIAEEVGVTSNVIYKRFSRVKGLLLDCVRRAISAGGV
ncbi:MAG: sigma-70 family RNA polymerase sigma factor [Phycisphaerae bacterium]|nr:sigma-70 family RNA polymerase sigma factor [Phycisphaerae bacterium]